MMGLGLLKNRNAIADGTRTDSLKQRNTASSAFKAIGAVFQS